LKNIKDLNTKPIYADYTITASHSIYFTMKGEISTPLESIKNTLDLRVSNRITRRSSVAHPVTK
jgi:hypothetical protein